MSEFVWVQINLFDDDFNQVFTGSKVFAAAGMLFLLFNMHVCFYINSTTSLSDTSISRSTGRFDPCFIENNVVK